MAFVVNMNQLESDLDSNDDISVNISDLSSIEENSDGEDVELGTKPYQFEPEADSDEIPHDQNIPDLDDDGRLGNNNWYGLCVSFTLFGFHGKHFEPIRSIFFLEVNQLYKEN